MFKRFYNWIIAWAAVNPLPALIIALAVSATIFFIWLFWQTDSKQEKKADEARSNVEMQTANTSVSESQVNRIEPQVQEREKVSQNAVKRAKEVRKKTNSNANLAEVQKWCEEAYGEANCR
jgi:flagellar biosynthesis component FlhA